jgi:hypothetical protein
VASYRRRITAACEVRQFRRLLVVDFNGMSLNLVAEWFPREDSDFANTDLLIQGVGIR